MEDKVQTQAEGEIENLRLLYRESEDYNAKLSDKIKDLQNEIQDKNVIEKALLKRVNELEAQLAQPKKPKVLGTTSSFSMSDSSENIQKTTQPFQKTPSKPRGRPPLSNNNKENSASKLSIPSSFTSPNQSPRKDTLEYYLEVISQAVDKKECALACEALIKKISKGLGSDAFYYRDAHKILIQALESKTNKGWYNKALKLLNNIVALSNTQQANELVKLGILPLVKEYCTYPNEEAQEQACWILHNFAIDPKIKEKLVEMKVLELMIAVLSNHDTKPLAFAKAMLALVPLTEDNTYNNEQNMPELKKLIKVCNKTLTSGKYSLQVVADTINVIFNITENEQAFIVDEIFETEIPKQVIESINYKSQNIQRMAVHTLSNLASNTSEQVKILLDLYLLPNIIEMITSDNKAIQLGACKCMSNVLAGTAEIIQEVLNAKIFPKLFATIGKIHKLRLTNMDVFYKSPEVYALYGILFASHGATAKQTQYLVENGIIPELIAVIDKFAKSNLASTINSMAEYEEFMSEALDGLFQILTKFTYQEFTRLIDITVKCQGWETIEQLARSNRNEKIRALANDLLPASIEKIYKTRESEDNNITDNDNNISTADEGTGGTTKKLLKKDLMK